jgi:putative membrane protein
MGIIISWLVLSAAVWVTARLVPGFEVKGGVAGALVVGAVFGLLHWALGKLLFALLVVGTLGLGYLLAFLTRWVVDAVLLKLADVLTDKLTIRSWGASLIGAAVMSLVGSVGEAIVRAIAHG